LSRPGSFCHCSPYHPLTNRSNARTTSFPSNRSLPTAGFSLVEILAVLAVFSIVTGLAVVSLGPLWQKHRLKQATGELMARIQTCRMQAILERRTVQIKTAGSVLSRRHKTGVDWSDWEQYRFPDPVRLSMSGTSSFYSKGFASPKTITVIHNDYQQKVIININGRARVSEIY